MEICVGAPLAHQTVVLHLRGSQRRIRTVEAHGGEVRHTEGRLARVECLIQPRSKTAGRKKIWVLIETTTDGPSPMQPKQTTKHDTTEHDTTQHKLTQHNTTQHNTTRYDTTRNDKTQHKNEKQVGNTRCTTTCQAAKVNGQHKTPTRRHTPVSRRQRSQAMQPSDRRVNNTAL